MVGCTWGNENWVWVVLWRLSKTTRCEMNAVRFFFLDDKLTSLAWVLFWSLWLNIKIYINVFVSLFAITVCLFVLFCFSASQKTLCLILVFFFWLFTCFQNSKILFGYWDNPILPINPDWNMYSILFSFSFSFSLRNKIRGNCQYYVVFLFKKFIFDKIKTWLIHYNLFALYFFIKNLK